MHTGQSYYAALGAELRLHGFPARSILYWRTPLHLGSIAYLPSPTWARILLIAGSIAALAMAVVVLVREANVLGALAQAVFMSGAFLVCMVPAGLFFAEVWAGMLIAISVGFYALERWRAAVAAGLLALFYRELSLPYVLLSIWLAWRARQRRELTAWLVGMAAYVAYFAFHAASAYSRITSMDVYSPVGWLQFGGVDSLLRMSRVGWLLAFPPSLTAIYLPCALLGLGGWCSAVGRRVGATVAIYMLAFATAGRPGNFYWGAVYTPLLAFGVAWSLPAIRDLLVVTFAKPSNEVARSPENVF